MPIRDHMYYPRRRHCSRALTLMVDTLRNRGWAWCPSIISDHPGCGDCGKRSEFNPLTAATAPVLPGVLQAVKRWSSAAGSCLAFRSLREAEIPGDGFQSGTAKPIQVQPQKRDMWVPASRIKDEIGNTGSRCRHAGPAPDAPNPACRCGAMGESCRRPPCRRRRCSAVHLGRSSCSRAASRSSGPGRGPRRGISSPPAA